MVETQDSSALGKHEPLLFYLSHSQPLGGHGVTVRTAPRLLQAARTLATMVKTHFPRTVGINQRLVTM